MKLWLRDGEEESNPTDFNMGVFRRCVVYTFYICGQRRKVTVNDIHKPHYTQLDLHEV